MYDLDDFDELSVDKKDVLTKREHEWTHISWHRMSIKGRITNCYTKIVQGYLSEAKLNCSTIIFIILKLRLHMLIYFFYNSSLSNFYSSIVRWEVSLPEHTHFAVIQLNPIHTIITYYCNSHVILSYNSKVTPVHTMKAYRHVKV